MKFRLRLQSTSYLQKALQCRPQSLHSSSPACKLCKVSIACGFFFQLEGEPSRTSGLQAENIQLSASISLAAICLCCARARSCSRNDVFKLSWIRLWRRGFGRGGGMVAAHSFATSSGTRAAASSSIYAHVSSLYTSNTTV